MPKYYCKYCGTSADSIRTLTSVSCTRNPVKGGRHETYEGSEKKQYVCKYCGLSASAISTLTSTKCSRNPKKGHHEPAL